MERRIGVVAILVHDRSSVPQLNAHLGEFHEIILARQGLPIRDRGIYVISLIVEGTNDRIGALTGKIGRLPGLKVKSVLTPYRENDDDPKHDDRVLSESGGAVPPRRDLGP